MARRTTPAGEFLVSWWESAPSPGNEYGHLTMKLWWSPRVGHLVSKNAKAVMSYNLDDALTITFQSDNRTRQEALDGKVDGPFYGGSVDSAPFRVSAAKAFSAFLECWANRGSSYTSVNKLLIMLGNVVVLKLRERESVYDVVERRRVVPMTRPAVAALIQDTVDKIAQEDAGGAA